MPKKNCTQCFKLKDLSEFSPNKAMKLGIQSACKECQKLTRRIYYKKYKKTIDAKQNEYRKANPDKVRFALIKTNYGMTETEYRKLLNDQNNRCAICRTKNPGAKGKWFHVDHSHKTKKIRGLLCTKCNQGLGYFNDDPIALRCAADYIEDGDK